MPECDILGKVCRTEGQGMELGFGDSVGKVSTVAV